MQLKKPSRRQVIRISVALIPLIFILILCSRKDSRIQVTACTVATCEIVESIPADGRIRPQTEIAISPEVSGEIVAIRCREGEEVQTGDTLVQIRPDVYLSLVERAAATLGTTRAELQQQSARTRQAKSILERKTKLFYSSAISRSELESAQADYEIACSQLSSARYGVQSAEAALREARDNLAKTVICAPCKGTVTRLDIQTGERVVGTSQMAGTELLRIADLSRMEIVTQVGENDIVKMHIGDSVSISVDAFAGREFSGIVSRMANSVKKNAAGIGQVTNFEVGIAILREDRLLSARDVELRPGMSATVHIITMRKSGILTVPLESIFTRGGEMYVWTMEEGSVHSRKITTGIQGIRSIEVTSGLAEGETVVTAPWQAITQDLRERMKVRCNMQNENEQSDTYPFGNER